MIDALIWVCVGVVIGAFAGDRFGAKVRGFVMDVIGKVRGLGKGAEQ